MHHAIAKNDIPVNPAVLSSLSRISPKLGAPITVPFKEELRKSPDSLFAHLNNSKVAVYIDGANFHSTTRSMGFVADYRKLRDLFSRNSNEVSLHYFVAINYERSENHPTVLLDSLSWMEKNGYILHQKSTKFQTDENGMKVLKGNMDVELTVEAMQTPDDVSHVVLVTGDGDFCKLVRTLQARGKYVTVISTDATHRRRIAEELRRTADRYVDIEDFRLAISRMTATPEARREHALRRGA